MSLFLAANNANTTLGSAANSTTTTMTVATGTGPNFAAPGVGQYTVLTLNKATPNLVNEIVWCTAIVGDTLTVLRGQEGTVAQSWAVGDLIANLWTAGQAEALVQASQLQIQATNSGVDAGALNAAAITLNPVPVSLASITGAPIRVLDLAHTNTGSITLNVNGLGAVPVLLPGGSPIPAGYLAAGQTFEANYDGSFFELQSIPASFAPSGPAGGDLDGDYPNPTIRTNHVVNSALAQAAALTIKGNLTGGTANVADWGPSAFLADFLGVGGAQSSTAAWFEVAVPSLPPFIVNLLQVTWNPTTIFPFESFSWPKPFPNACIYASGNDTERVTGGGLTTQGSICVVAIAPTTTGGTLREDSNGSINFAGTHTTMIIGIGW